MTLKELRINKGLTQNELAYIAGTAIPYISRAENNKHKLSVINMVNIATKLSVTITIYPSGNIEYDPIT